MRIGLAIAGSLALVACTTTVVRTPSVEQADVVIRNVTVIDPKSRSVSPASDVYLDDGRIVEIAITGASTRPVAGEVAGDGQYLIPGLMDMHAHTSYRPVHDSSLKMMLANGVLGIREMGSDCVEPGGISMCLEEMRTAQARIEAGELLGPRILELSSSKVDSDRSDDAGDTETLYRPMTAEDAGRTVAWLHEREVDILKVGDQFMPEAFVAFAAAARERDMRFGGHIPPYLSVAEVAELGMTSVEHARDLPLDCSEYGAEFRSVVMAALSGESDDWPDRRQMPARARDTFEAERCQGQIAAMLENGTYYVPTHLTREMDYRAGDDDYRADPRFAYIPAMQRQVWYGDMNRKVVQMDGFMGDLADFFELGLRTTGMAHVAGVPIMAGTDANDTMVFPGFSLHDELRHLVAAGLSPMDALRAATSVPAEYLGRTSDFGGIAPDMMADLVLLDANPLDDIGNTTRIAGVFFGGTYYDGAAIDTMLAELRAWVETADEQGSEPAADD